MLAAVWVVLWADDAPAPAREQAIRAIQAERLAFTELRAQPPQPRTGELSRRATQAYQAMRFAEARARFDEAIAEAVAGGAAGLSAADLADLYLGRALCAEASGASGFDDFVSAARIAPTRLLDPGRSPPSALQTFARAQQAVQQASRGALLVEAPTGAAVFLDGDPAGRAPLRLQNLPHGERLVRAEAPGHVPAAARVVHSGAETSVRLEGELAGPPALLAIVAQATARGAKRVLIVAVQPSGGATVERLDVRAGRVDAVESTAAGDLGAAIRRLLAPAPPPDRFRPAAWVVGGVVVGAAVTALVLLLGGDEGDDGIRASADPSGAVPPQ